MDFELSTTTIDGVGAMLISVEGELDISTVERLGEPTALAVSTGCPLVLDLSACAFIDSSGLRFVLRAHKALSQEGKPMVVVTDRPQVRKLLSVTAIDLSVRVFADLDQAIAWLGTSGSNGDSASQSSLSSSTAQGSSPSSAGS